MAIKQVHVLSSFEDIEKAFSGIRSSGDPDPMMEYEARLTVEEDSGGLLLSNSSRYVLSDNIRNKGNEFIEWCVKKVVYSFKLDK